MHRNSCGDEMIEGLKSLLGVLEKIHAECVEDPPEDLIRKLAGTLRVTEVRHDEDGNLIYKHLQS